MTPLDYYHELCKSEIIADPEQLAALQILQNLYQKLLIENKKRSGIRGMFHRPQLLQGVYLWGGVGIGKTFMMDCFYHCLPFTQKLRMHFHQFMHLIHQELTKNQGKPDPLTIIADDLAKKTQILCFDEFLVSDITDAMLLAQLLKAFFKKGLCLVVTSNTSPDDLYKNGLQRSQFLPAIALLKKHTDVIKINKTIDYRLRHIQEAGVFYTPLDQEAEKNMQKTFSTLTHGKQIDELPIIIYGRSIRVKKKAEDIIWFDFVDICSVPRSQHDYLMIAEKYHTVFISHVPVIPPEAKDVISLFVNLVDVFYDAKTKLVISAAESIQDIYNRGHLILDYSRTHSRLIEMQSMDYFSDFKKE